MEYDEGTFVPQFLDLFNAATEVVNPLNLYTALVHEHLNVLDFHDIMTQYQSVELYLDSFEDSPAVTGPGCAFFQFMHPQIAEYSVTRKAECLRSNLILLNKFTFNYKQYDILETYI